MGRRPRVVPRYSAFIYDGEIKHVPRREAEPDDFKENESDSNTQSPIPQQRKNEAKEIISNQDKSFIDECRLEDLGPIPEMFLADVMDS